MKTIIFISLMGLSLSAFSSNPRGSYNNGTLEDGECLQENGEGYIQLFKDVNRIFATSEMITMITESAADMARKYPGRDRLEVEDMAQKGGGNITDHASHENGLDADIEYFKANSKEHVPHGPRDFDVPMLNEDGSVSGNFDVERNWELFKALHKHGRVTRVFIHPALKQSICRYARSIGEISSGASVLRSLSPEVTHTDHFHVRLQCPADARGCRNMPPKSGPTGCQ
jgi:penicillin-insensitive murein endopeptidase